MGEGRTLADASGGLLQSGLLGRATPPGGQFSDVIKEDRALQWVELRGVGGDLCEKGIGHQHGCLFGVARGGVAEQGRHIDFERARQAI